MGTFLSLHIRHSDQGRVTELLQGLSHADEMLSGPYPKELDDNILMDENADPTFMAVADVQEGWIYIHINSFKKLHNWVEKISKELNTSVIQIIGQTTSDAYYFLMYDKGELRREINIYHGDFDSVVDKGEKFPFEPASLIPETDEDFENLFDIDTIGNYCNALGFDLFLDTFQKTFFILKRKNTIITFKTSDSAI